MTRTTTQARAELADTIGHHVAADAAAFAHAYRLGYETGVQVGRAQLDHELTEQDRRHAEYLRGIASTTTHAELVRRRTEPGGDAYYAALIRHGGTEFAGIDKPRVPAPPGAYERALAWANRQRHNAA